MDRTSQESRRLGVERELRDILEHAEGEEEIACCLDYYNNLPEWEQVQTYTLLTWPDTTFENLVHAWIDHALNLPN